MRLGIIGAGAVAEFHAVSAKRLPTIELAAVCDLDQQAAERIAGPAGAATFTDYRQMYANAGLDAVIINTPHALHLEMVLAAAQAGLHVLVEKPMATTVGACDEMIQACRDAGVKLVVGQIQHFLPEKIAVEQVLAGGTLGPVRMIRDSRSTDYRPGTRPAWFFNADIAGGGALMNIGGHCLDRSLWFGGAPAVALSARTVNRFGVDVETDGFICAELANGVHVNISVVSDPPARMDEVLVVCERGIISSNPRRGTVVQQDGASRMIWESSPDDIQDGFYRQLADFAAVLAGAEPKVSTTHARHVVEAILAAYQSSSSGLPVALGAAPMPVAAQLESQVG